MKQIQPFNMDQFITQLQGLESPSSQYNQKNASTSPHRGGNARNRQPQCDKKASTHSKLPRNSCSENSDGVSSSTSSSKKSNVRLARLIEPEKYKSPNRRRNGDSFSQLLKQQSGGAIAKNADFFAGTKSSPDPSALPMPPKHWFSNNNSANSTSEEQKSPKSNSTTPKRQKKKHIAKHIAIKADQPIAANVQNFFSNFNNSPTRQQVISTA